MLRGENVLYSATSSPALCTMSGRPFNYHVLVGPWTRGSDLAMCAGWSVDPRVGRAPPRDRCIIVETPPGSSVDDPRATATPRNFTPHYLPVICPPEITNAEVRVWVMFKV